MDTKINSLTQLKQNILLLFKQLNQLIKLNDNNNITQIEIIPIHIHDKLYLSGIKINNDNNNTIIQLHIKEFNTIKTYQNDDDNKDVIANTPTNDLLINITLLNPNIMTLVIKQLITKTKQLNNFIVGQLQYKLKTDFNNSPINNITILYQNKKIAAKHATNIRKLSTLFKSNFLNINTNDDNNNITITNNTNDNINTNTNNNNTVDEESLAEMPLE